jgi:hypothetical protein
MLIAASAVGLAGFIVRVVTSVQVIRAMRLDNGDPVATTVNGAIFYDPLIATALGLGGGGMARRGRLDAHDELFQGTSSKRSARAKLGWGLFGAGAGVWAITRVVGLKSCRESGDCTARVWETGYYLSLALTVPGAILGGYATGYNGYQRRFGHLAQVSLAPIAHRNAWGLAVSGRF